MVAHKVGNNAPGEKIENRGVPKEACDIDQQVPGELIAFVGVAKQEVEILGCGFDPNQRHPPLDARLERAMLVKSKIVSHLPAQESDDVRQQIVHRLLRGRLVPFGHKDVVSFARDQRLGDLCRTSHEIDRARRDGASGHAVIVRFADVLRDDETAAFLNRSEAKTAVGAGSGKDYADRAGSIFTSEGIQEEVERKPRAVSCLRLGNPQRALVVNRQIDARRNDIDALALDRHSVGRQQDRHRGMARKQIHHHAVVARVQVLHDDEGHAVDRRQRVQKLPAGIEASGRGANRDDRKLRSLAGREGLRYPARSLPLDDMIEASRHSESFLDGRRSKERVTINSDIRARLRPISTHCSAQANVRERES